MNKAILDTDIQDFINKNINADISRLSLSKSPFPSVSSKELAEQIDSKRRAEYKLPLWFNTSGIYYPLKISIEQASSEIAARYKADLIRGEKVIDLTGGFGVDSYFFSKKEKDVTHCEINKGLSEISQHNAQVLGADIQFVNADGLEYLRISGQTFDTIYVDPSRRKNARKVFLLKDCEPDVPGNMDLFLKKSDRIIIKTAPLLDLQSTISELKQVSEVHVISIKNECKEIVWIIDKNESKTDPAIVCAALIEHKTQIYRFRLSEEKEFRITDYSDPLTFIYEPDVALLKAGCFKLISRDFGLGKLHQHTHLYTSGKLNSNFIGRSFKLKKTWNYGAFMKENTVRKANIICRNFPLSPETLRKKLKINDGGEEYLLFCTGRKNELLVLNCERL